MKAPGKKKTTYIQSTAEGFVKEKRFVLLGLLTVSTVEMHRVPSSMTLV